MPLVTLSAPYGAGGSQVGPLVADRLGVPFVDRAVPSRVAERLAIPLDRALSRDESVGSWLARSSVWLGHVGDFDLVRPVIDGSFHVAVLCDRDHTAKELHRVATARPHATPCNSCARSIGGVPWIT